MSHASPSIRAAGESDTSDAVATVVAAFITDPVARFALPSAEAYLQVMPLFTREFGGPALSHQSAYVSDDLAAAALWLPPGIHADDAALEKLFRDYATPAHLDDLLGTFEQMGQCHPDEPHWYLPMIGVDPSAQGRGLGGELMRHAVARCDEEGHLAYLESSNPRNISLYIRHGFEVMGTIQVGDAPVVTPMLRRPR